MLRHQLFIRVKVLGPGSFEFTGFIFAPIGQKLLHHRKCTNTEILREEFRSL